MKHNSDCSIIWLNSQSVKIDLSIIATL